MKELLLNIAMNCVLATQPDLGHETFSECIAGELEDVSASVDALHPRDDEALCRSFKASMSSFGYCIRW
jgi:hypothetical protein